MTLVIRLGDDLLCAIVVAVRLRFAGAVHRRSVCFVAVGGKWLSSPAAACVLPLYPAPACRLPAELRASVHLDSQESTHPRDGSMFAIIFSLFLENINRLNCCCVFALLSPGARGLCGPALATLVCRAPSFAGHPRICTTCRSRSGGGRFVAFAAFV